MYPSQDKTDEILNDLEDVRNIMGKNVEKISLHIVDLDDLDHKAEQMKNQSALFKKSVLFIKDLEWWKSKKFYLQIGGIILIIVIILIITIAVSTHKN